MTQTELPPEHHIYTEAVNSFGSRNQTRQAIEECAELITALCQYTRSRLAPIDVAQEIADVEIMCAQLRIIFGSDLVDAEKEKKLRRLAQKLKQHSP